jgi:hypothetical protein
MIKQKEINNLLNRIKNGDTFYLIFRNKKTQIYINYDVDTHNITLDNYPYKYELWELMRVLTVIANTDTNWFKEIKVVEVNAKED